VTKRRKDLSRFFYTIRTIISPYFASFPPNSTDFQADVITVVEDRHIMSVKYCFPVPVFHFWPKLSRTLQRGLSAIAEHLVLFQYSFQQNNLGDYLKL